MEYTVFDTIVQLLLNSKNYTAPKGNGHGKADKVGYGKCTEDTVMGAIAVKYFASSMASPPMTRYLSWPPCWTGQG